MSKNEKQTQQDETTYLLSNSANKARLLAAIAQVEKPLVNTKIDCKEIAVPIISMFYGIIIRMYLMDNQHHNTPHIHAKYAEFEASIAIEEGEILAGQLPRKQLRLVQAWIELHRDELMADWELAVSGETPYKVSPL